MRIFARVVVGLGLLYYLGIFVVVVGLSRDRTLTDEFTFAAVAIVLFSLISIGLRRAAGLRMQRIALIAAALWFLYGCATLLSTWPPEDVLPFLVLFVLPTTLVSDVLWGCLPRGQRG
jgi:hypothetical protein